MSTSRKKGGGSTCDVRPTADYLLDKFLLRDEVENGSEREREMLRVRRLRRGK